MGAPPGDGTLTISLMKSNYLISNFSLNVETISSSYKDALLLPFKGFSPTHLSRTPLHSSRIVVEPN